MAREKHSYCRRSTLVRARARPSSSPPPSPGLSLDASALPRHWNVSASVRADARSLLLAVDSGARVLHWTELDHSDDRGSADYLRATLLWPAGRLNDSTRYIVAYRNVVSDSGAAVASPPGFAALRDGTPSSSPDVEASRRA